MSLLRNLLHIARHKNLTAVFCMLAYLLLVIHDITPHHHEEDLGAHDHGVHSQYAAHDDHDDHSARPSHHHHKNEGSIAGKPHQHADECLLFVHHVHSEDGFVSSKGNKNLSQHYILNSADAVVGAPTIWLDVQAAVFSASTLSIFADSGDPRGPPMV